MKQTQKLASDEHKSIDYVYINADAAAGCNC